MKKIIIILIVLIIILLSLSYLQKSRSSDEEGIELIYEDHSIFLSYTQILSFEKSQFSTTQNQEMNGYDLIKILETIDIPTSIETEYVFHSQDGGTLKLTIKQNETFYLIFQDGAGGQFVRLVIPGDEFSQRWIKYITSIEIK